MKTDTAINESHLDASHLKVFLKDDNNSICDNTSKPCYKHFDQLHKNPIRPQWSKTQRVPTNEQTLLISSDRIVKSNHSYSVTKNIKLYAHSIIKRCCPSFFKLSSTLTDPFVRITLMPNRQVFQTLPIFRGGCNVQFSPFDKNSQRFDFSENVQNKEKMLLVCEVFDYTFKKTKATDSNSDNKQTNSQHILLGRCEISLATLSGNETMYAQVPLRSEKTEKFAGNLELSVWFTEDCMLEIKVYDFYKTKHIFYDLL